MARIALGLEYDGAGFAGWQSQAGGGGVQDAVEAAVSRVAAGATRVVCAGRTDAGVHAVCQVAHFESAAERPLSAWVRGVNAHLPESVAVRWAVPVPAEFHARFSARSRSYRYLLLNRAQRPGLLVNRVGWHHRPLEATGMQAAARHLLGSHDFSVFRSAECQAKSPVKTLRRAEVARYGDLVVFEFSADAFLHHMIRNIVGALVAVGQGGHPPEWMAELLAGRDRRRAPPTFSPHGLYFIGVDYDPRFGIPEVGAGGTPVLL